MSDGWKLPGPKLGHTNIKGSVTRELEDPELVSRAAFTLDDLDAAIDKARAISANFDPPYAVFVYRGSKAHRDLMRTRVVAPEAEFTPELGGGFSFLAPRNSYPNTFAGVPLFVIDPPTPAPETLNHHRSCMAVDRWIRRWLSPRAWLRRLSRIRVRSPFYMVPATIRRNVNYGPASGSISTGGTDIRS